MENNKTNSTSNKSNEASLVVESTKGIINQDEIKKLLDENKKLKQQLEENAELKKQLAALTNKKQPITIDPDRDITVISLTHGIYILSTIPNGGGRVYRFNEFGEEAQVPYSDLKDMFQAYRKNFEEGYCYISDKDVVSALRLNKYYENILDKKEIETLFTKNKTSFSKIFNAAPKVQQNTIVELLIKKLSENEEVDMNLVKIVSDATGKNIEEAAEYLKASRITIKE